MPDDAYEFLGPDLLAPPPPAQGVPPPNGPPGVEVPQAPANELVPTSAAEKFQVQPTAPETKRGGSTSNSKESIKKTGKGTKGSGGKGKSRKHATSTSRESEPMPSLGAFKCQMIFSAIAVTASVGLTLMVLIDGLL